LESEFIRDQKGGAKVLKFTELSDENLRRMVWSFPEARAEYLKRFVYKKASEGAK
jgi:hypothetical protein